MSKLAIITGADGGMGTFGVAKGIAVALVFTGVYIVTQSKSREQMLAEQAAKKE